LIHSVWTREMFYNKTYKDWETTQRLIRHYDLLAKLYVYKGPYAKEHSFFSMQHLHVTWENSEN
jgi:hypothetical protein